jgi:hypothetical protein
MLAAVGVVALMLGALLWHRGGVHPTGEYRLSEEGDLVVRGRWTCAATAFSALLRPTTGEVWVWTAWPTSSAGVAGRLVTRIAGATSLHVRQAASGCDVLIVTRAGRPPVAINPAPTGRGTD